MREGIKPTIKRFALPPKRLPREEPVANISLDFHLLEALEVFHTQEEMRNISYGES